MVDADNIKNSFRLVKNDMMKLQEEIFSVGNMQKEILKELKKLNIEELKLEQKVDAVSKRKPRTKIVTKTITKRPKRLYVAAKEGTKFHIEKCPYAKNIKPRGKVKFKSQTAALKKGLKPCNCVK
ncbi:hypothetical protein GOV13_04965 [Candidatus Pacearchaeota archaeon]|nr:hypothetical protein [Candidatus Pacearchaeota archaeon]